jgi:Domain of unknown function (DUF4407)
VSGYLWAALSILGAALSIAGALAMTTLSDMASEEARDRLEHIPHAILRLAARRLDPGQRATVYQAEWLPELKHILEQAEGRPITRLITGTRFALGIFASSRRIARHLHRPAPGQPDHASASPPGAEESFRSVPSGAREFLIALSGARPEILAHCRTERIKFQSLGWAILITCAMAMVSMWFALAGAMGINALATIPVAIMWGLVIMGIDRWLITSMPIDGSRKWAMAVPRLLLALLLGTLISAPIVLRVFQPEINSQITVIKDQNAAAFSSAQQDSWAAQQVTRLANAVNNLQQVIDTRGTEAINSSSDPLIQSLTGQRAAELSLEQQYFHKWQCQLHGGSGCLAGNGPLAQASEASYRQAMARVTALASQIQARENQLTSADAASEQSRYQQAVGDLPTAQQQLAAAADSEDALQSSFNATNEATNGLLIRLQALSQLSAGNFTLSTARALLFLLFLVIECLPITVKLLQRSGNYELILQAVTRRELDDARRAFRNHRPPPDD